MRKIFALIMFCALTPVSYAASLPDIITMVRNDPSDFSAWLQFRDKHVEIGTPEKNYCKYEPVFIAVYDRQAVDKATGAMVITAVILPGKNDGFYNLEGKDGEVLAKACAYAKKLSWYSQDGRRVNKPDIRIIGQRLVMTGASGDIAATCSFIDVREVDENNQEWRRYYKKARKKDLSLGRLTWLFLLRGSHLWGIGYEIKEETMLPGQPMKRGARLALVSKSSTGSILLKF